MTSQQPQRTPAPANEDVFDQRPLVALLPIFAAVRTHPFVVIAIALAALGACGAWLLQRSPYYEARAQILVTPLVEGETAFVGLPIVRTAPGDPTRTVKTAASIASSPEAAARAARELEEVSAATVRGAVTVEAVEDTNVINVIAGSTDPELAAEIASAYADAVLDVRRRELKPQVDKAIRRTRRQLETIPDPTGATAVELRVRLSQLGTISDGFDPTLSIAQLADVPRAPAGRPAWQLLLLAAAAGMIVGVGTALLLRMASPRRIEDDDALAAVLPLPVLARVPADDDRGDARGREPWRAAGSRDAYHLLGGRIGYLATTPAEATGHDGRAAMTAILEVEPGTGSTIASAGLVSALIDTGATVVAFDLNRGEPGLGGLLSVTPERRLTRTGNPEALLEEVLEPAPDERPLGVVAAEANAPGLRRLLAAARAEADHVIVDADSTRTIRDGLTLLHDVSVVVVVVRYGETRPESLALVAELLVATNVTAKAGYLVFES